MNNEDAPVAQLEFHPIANVFPLIEGDEFQALVEDIREHGVHEPIWLYEGKILDGRNRYRAYQAAFPDIDEDPPFREYLDEKPVEFVVSLNLKRRHLNESQRAMVGAKLATLGHGGDRSKSPIGDLTQQQAADLLNVGKRSVERAADVRDHGAPELQQAVERGAVSVSAAADVATLTQDEQQEIVARGEREILKAAVAIRARKNEARLASRTKELSEISRNSAPLPKDRQYPVLLVDPPWQYETAPLGDVARSVADKYPTMPLAGICALPVESLSTQDAVLFMWAVSPLLPQGFEVLKAWGFEYVAEFIWDKEKIGLGSWVRGQHEHLLIARRGNMPCPLPANRPASMIRVARREHSRKPDEAYELIERMYPDLPKIELFARQAREGWAAWGNQAPAAEEAA